MRAAAGSVCAIGLASASFGDLTLVTDAREVIAESLITNLDGIDDTIDDAQTPGSGEDWPSGEARVDHFFSGSNANARAIQDSTIGACGLFGFVSAGSGADASSLEAADASATSVFRVFFEIDRALAYTLDVSGFETSGGGIAFAQLKVADATDLIIHQIEGVGAVNGTLEAGLYQFTVIARASAFASDDARASAGAAINGSLVFVPGPGTCAALGLGALRVRGRRG